MCRCRIHMSALPLVNLKLFHAHIVLVIHRAFAYTLSFVLNNQNPREARVHMLCTRNIYDI